MATKVKEMPKGAGIPRYPWDTWLDGGIWKLSRGKDFDSEVYNLRNCVHQAAKRRGIKVRTVMEGDSIYIQAVPA